LTPIPAVNSGYSTLWGGLGPDGKVACTYYDGTQNQYMVKTWTLTSGLQTLTQYTEPVPSGMDDPGYMTEANGVTESGVVLGSAIVTFTDPNDCDHTRFDNTDVRWDANGNGPTPMGDVISDDENYDSQGPVEVYTPNPGTLFGAADENGSQMDVGWGEKYNGAGDTDVGGPALWQSGALTFLPFRGDGILSEVVGAFSINNATSPLIVGGDGDADDDPDAVLWVKVSGHWKEKDLGAYNVASHSNAVLPGWATKVNDRCEIIITEPLPSAPWQQGVLWQNDRVIDLSTRVPAGWSNVSPYDLNNSGAMLATATGSDGASHHVMLLPLQIDKVWSDQNGNLGDMSNNNYFTSQNSNNTGSAHSTFMMMGFRSDELGHVKAHITIPDMAYFKNKLLVRLAIQPDGPGTQIIPVGDGTYDPTSNIASMTYDGIYNGSGSSSLIGDWLVVAGFDANGDGDLQASEIAAQTTYKIRAIGSSDYTASMAFLQTSALIARTTTLVPYASAFLNAFLNDSSPGHNSSASTTTIQPNDPRLDYNVGALFMPAGGGSIKHYDFPETSDLAESVAMSATFTAEIYSELGNHANLMENYNYTQPTQQFTWTVDKALNFLPDDIDLVEAFGGVKLHIVTTVLVRASDKTVLSVAYTGYISDLYDFAWYLAQDDSVAQLISAEANQNALSVQAGYNTLGSGGHIFETQVDFNTTRTDITYRAGL